jgi:hypothetical protein
MFVRKKNNISGVVSIQIIDKSSGKYRLLKTIGSSANENEITRLVIKAKQWIQSKIGLTEFDFTDYQQHTDFVLDGITQINVHGTELLIGKLFDEIGFNTIPDNIFKLLVLARLSFPVSKLKTTDFLSKYHFINIDVHNVYRYLDKLYNTQKDLVQQISYTHTLQILNKEISIVFYDVTTLYFEAEQEDDLRKTGFRDIQCYQL